MGSFVSIVPGTLELGEITLPTFTAPERMFVQAAGADTISIETRKRQIYLKATYRGSPLHTVSVHTDSHHTVFSGPPRLGFDGFYGTLNFKNLL